MTERESFRGFFEANGNFVAGYRGYSACLAVFGLVIGALATEGLAAIQFEETTYLAGVEHEGPSFGASWGFFNDDAWPDLWVSNHAFPNSLYINDGLGGFDLASDVIFPASCGDTHGGAWADFDNDGDQDLIQLAGAGFGSGSDSNCFYENANGVLTDRAVDFGVDYPLGRGRTPLWFDWNNDGLLDLVLFNLIRGNGEGATAVFSQVTNFFQNDSDLVGFPVSGNNPYGHYLVMGVNNERHLLVGDWNFPHRLFNLSSVPFTDVTSMLSSFNLSGVRDSVFEDFDGDLLVDAYITRASRVSQVHQSNDHTLIATLLPSGQDTGFDFATKGAVTFKIDPPFWNIENVVIGSAGRQPSSREFTLTPQMRIGSAPDHVSGGANKLFIGADARTGVWTVANSGAGQVNLTITTELPARKLRRFGFTSANGGLEDIILRQTASGFENVTDAWGTNQKTVGWSVVAEDFDNDMDIDLYVVSAEMIRNIPNILLENAGNGTFSIVPSAGGAAGEVLGVGDAVASADYDVDGFMDIFITNGNDIKPFNEVGTNQLFRNLGNGNNWTQIDLVGTVSNRDGMGAVVFVTAGNKTQMRLKSGRMHRYVQDLSRLHFGLGANESIDEIRVEWPSGTVQILNDVQPNSVLVIQEPAMRKPKIRSAPKAASGHMAPGKSGPRYRRSGNIRRP